MGIAVVLAFRAGAAEPEKLAVLEFETQKGLHIDRTYFSDKVRGSIREAVPNIFILTRESMEVLLRANGTTSDACADDKLCEVDKGRLMQVKYVVSGRLAKVGRRLALTLRLHRTDDAALMASKELLANDADGLVDGTAKTVESLIADLKPSRGAQRNPSGTEKPPPAAPTTVMNRPAESECDFIRRFSFNQNRSYWRQFVIGPYTSYGGEKLSEKYPGGTENCLISFEGNQMKCSMMPDPIHGSYELRDSIAARLPTLTRCIPGSVFKSSKSHGSEGQFALYAESSDPPHVYAYFVVLGNSQRELLRADPTLIVGIMEADVQIIWEHSSAR